MEIYKALAEINRNVEAIKKEKTNQQQGFKYRGIDQVMNELHDIFAKNGVIVTSDITNSFREERTNKNGTTLIWSIIDYKFTLSTIDGSSISTTVRGEAMDSGDKGANKCYAVALKYAMFGMFMIPTEDFVDPDKELHEVKPKTETKPQAAATPAKPQPPKYTPEQISAAVTEMQNAKTLPDCIAIWKKHAAIQTNPAFLSTKESKKAELDAAAKADPIAEDKRQINKAVATIKLVQSLDELEAVKANYSNLSRFSEFLHACENRKAEIINAKNK